MPRYSFEREAVELLQSKLGDVPRLSVHVGLTPDNRFAPTSWRLAPGQFFQFGDLRLETAGARFVFEVESAGGVGNLVKYWPILDQGFRDEKRFVLVHLFRMTSEQDYVAHRRLWEYLAERMKDDLGARGRCHWDSGWLAKLFTYRAIPDPVFDEVARFVKAEATRSAIPRRGA